MLYVFLPIIPVALPIVLFPWMLEDWCLNSILAFWELKSWTGYSVTVGIWWTQELGDSMCPGLLLSPLWMHKDCGSLMYLFPTLGERAVAFICRSLPNFAFAVVCCVYCWRFQGLVSVLFCWICTFSLLVWEYTFFLNLLKFI